jgi:hypothetical protein
MATLMATLPKTLSYEERLDTPPVRQEAGAVEVLRLLDGGLRHVTILAEGILKPKPVPSVEIDIAQIWPD